VRLQSVKDAVGCRLWGLFPFDVKAGSNPF
jgi:hypothetical protein